MKNIITFSGGKDSTAVLLWAKNTLSEYEVVFCDTGWEAPETYDYISYVQDAIGKEIIILKSKKYDGFEDLSEKKKRFPSSNARFCTDELKVKPMIDYILSVKEDMVIYQGIRADESLSRRYLNKNDDYFKHYFEPYGINKKGHPKLHNYRKAEVLQFCNEYSADVVRPILDWTSKQVFEYIRKNGIKPNPLYLKGFSRVGCFPCIMCRQSELKSIVEHFPDVIEKIEKIEKKTNMYFFSPNYIPIKNCTVEYVKKDGTRTKLPSIKDVVKYLNNDQLTLFESKNNCVSVYNICE
jgi:3'-phosphoadenosine 5'-phosphosulfate sulfotransferase (PAPS reductase)/FAD synthetase